MRLRTYITILFTFFSLHGWAEPHGRGFNSSQFGGGSFGGGPFGGNQFGGGPFGSGQFGGGQFGGGQFGGGQFGGGQFGSGQFGGGGSPFGGGLPGGGGIQNDGHARKAAEEINKLGEKAIENINKLGEDAQKNYEKLTQSFGSAVEKVVSQPDGVKESLEEVNKNAANLAELSRSNSAPIAANTVDEIVEAIKANELTKEKQLEAIKMTLAPPANEPVQKFESVGNAIQSISSIRSGNPLAEAIGAREPDSLGVTPNGPDLGDGKHNSSRGFSKEAGTYNPPERSKNPF